MDMMKQARDLQKNMQALQAELAQTEVTGTAGGGLVEVTLTATNDLRQVKIKPQAVDADDIETLEDLVQAAVSDALARAKSLTESRMKSLTGGLNLPGM